MAALDKFMDQELEALRYMCILTYMYVVGNQSSVLHHMAITWLSHGHTWSSHGIVSCVFSCCQFIHKMCYCCCLGNATTRSDCPSFKQWMLRRDNIATDKTLPLLIVIFIIPLPYLVLFLLYSVLLATPLHVTIN